VNSLLEEMRLLQDEIVNLLEMQQKTENTSTNDAHNERHIQNSKPQSIIEFEPSSEKELEATPTQNNQPTEGTMRVFPLGLVLKACPEVMSYGPGGAVNNWRDLMSAAVVVRSMLGVSPSAYQEACEVMGPENAAVTMACILERSGHI
ncbi:plasmid replication protein RepC, partial [Pseudomonas sp. RGM 3321]